jgi:hypothetical protein
MRFNHVTPFALVFLLAAKISCAGAETYAWQSRSYANGQFAALMSGREILVVLQGNPFHVSRRVVESAVVDAMQNALPYIHARFTASSITDAIRRFKVVLILNGPQAAEFEDICEGRKRFHAAPVRSRLDAFAVLCRGGTAISMVTASAMGIESSGDAKFAELISTVSRGLLPHVSSSPREPDASVLAPELGVAR